MYQRVYQHTMGLTTVRLRTSADFEGLETAIRQCHAKTGYPLEGVKDARAFICDNQGPLEQAWVAECNGEIVGHIAINAPVEHCPCVSTWRQSQRDAHTDPNRSLATVGRLFVNPGRAKGVLQSLADAVRRWSWEMDTHLIMYVVVWSPARALMADVLTGRQGWTEFGRSIYHSPDGWAKDAVCYEAPPEWRTAPPPVVVIRQASQLESSLHMQLAARMSAFLLGWQTFAQVVLAYYKFGWRQLALNCRSIAVGSVTIHSLPGDELKG